MTAVRRASGAATAPEVRNQLTGTCFVPASEPLTAGALARSDSVSGLFDRIASVGVLTKQSQRTDISSSTCLIAALGFLLLNYRSTTVRRLPIRLSNSLNYRELLLDSSTDTC